MKESHLIGYSWNLLMGGIAETAECRDKLIDATFQL